MQLLTDNPIMLQEQDQYGFKSYAKALKEAILQAEPLPLCVGILGVWGSGKSSFMVTAHHIEKEQGMPSRLLCKDRQ